MTASELGSTSLGRTLTAAAAQAAEAVASAEGMAPEAARRALTGLAVAVYAHATGSRARREVPPAFPRSHVDAFRRAFVSRLTSRRPKRVNGREILAVLASLETFSGNGAGSANGGPPRQEILEGMLEIAHDMRSPLNAILLLADPIRRGKHGPVTPTQERQLGLVYGAALGLTSLANDIIDAARGEPGEFIEHPFSIREVIQDACAVVRPVAEEKQLELREVYPATDARMGDSAALHRVLLNLATNALRCTERGSVEVGARDIDDRRVEFWVVDTGPGIPDTLLATLFDEFRPGPPGSRFSSSGLGLSICRRLLAAQGSSLRVDTAVGEGTRFSFVLDLEVA